MEPQRPPPNGGYVISNNEKPQLDRYTLNWDLAVARTRRMVEDGLQFSTKWNDDPDPWRGGNAGYAVAWELAQIAKPGATHDDLQNLSAQLIGKIGEEAIRRTLKHVFRGSGFISDVDYAFHQVGDTADVIITDSITKKGIKVDIKTDTPRRERDTNCLVRRASCRNTYAKPEDQEWNEPRNVMKPPGVYAFARFSGEVGISLTVTLLGWLPVTVVHDITRYPLVRGNTSDNNWMNASVPVADLQPYAELRAHVNVLGRTVEGAECR